VDYVDIITEPGPAGILGGKKDEALIESIRRRVEISVQQHGSRYIAIVAHHDCAGNPVDAQVHLAQAERAVERVQSWGFDCEVVPLWVSEDWEVHVIDDALKAVVRG
jgi:carbonic anhydrase